MGKFIALCTSVLTGALLFGDTPQRSVSQVYSKPTFAQVMRLIATVKGNTSEHGPWDDGSVPTSYLYSTPTYAQVDELIQAVKESGGGGGTNSVTREAFIAATNLLTQLKVSTNDFSTVTNELHGEISDLDVKIEKLSDGTQKYLRIIDFFDTFDADADWYAEWADEHGYCTSMRYGNVYVRNYDWKYTEAMTYVGRLHASSNRYASVFVCNVGTNLTPAVEGAGEWTRFHRALPGRAVDGINERGVVCNINVVTTNGSPWETKGGTRNLSLTRACRYVLDHFDNAHDAADYVAEHGYVPDALKRQGFSVHMMIADANGTYIVEDGMTHGTGPTESVTPMTNFRVVNTTVSDPYGSGHARYDVMAAVTQAPAPETALAAAIQSVWYTHAYVRGADGDFPWPDEFAGTVVVTNEAGRIVGVVEEPTGSPWEHKLRYYETNLLQEACQFVIPDVPHDRWPRNGSSWQTIHCSVYDISNRCLRIAVQEDPKWVVVSVPAGGVGGSSYIPSADDPTFSNAVLSVGLGFATNEVTSAAYIAATNALSQLGFDADALADLPGGKVYGSVSALLAALAAAVAWLKKNKADKGEIARMTNLGDGRYEYAGALDDSSTRTYPREEA